MKKKSIKKTLFVLLIAVFGCLSFFTVKAEENSILNNIGKWTGYFGSDWAGANGTFNCNDDKEFSMDITSIGHSNEWAVQAELDAQASLKMGNTYDYKSEIVSDKDRKIYIKIQGTNDSDIIFDKWIELKAGKTYTLSESFMSDKFYDHFKIFYALGWSASDIASADSTNNIKVTNISLTKEAFDYSKLSYNNVINGSATIENYSYSTITGILGDILAHNYPADGSKVSIYFPVAAAPIETVTVNNVETDFFTNGGALAYITLDKFDHEYNDIVMVKDGQTISQVIIKNSNVTIAKNNALKTIDDYLTADASERVKAIINTAKQEVSKAETIVEVNEIVKNLPNKIALQNEKEQAIEKIEKYLTENASAKIKKLIEDTKKEINNATTKDEIDNIMTKFIPSANLQLAKDKAIDELTVFVGKEYSAKIKEIYTKAIEDINEATTEKDINTILETAKKDISIQIEKENSKQEVENPLTLDNIIIYFILLVIGVGGVVYLLIYFIRNKKGK